MKKKVTFKGIWQILKESFVGFDNDKVFKLSGSLAYFTIFSIGPMLIIMIFLLIFFMEGKPWKARSMAKSRIS